MTIDGVVPNTTSTPTASDEDVEILWTVMDLDSEDLNANGVFDNILGDEDINGNGEADFEPVAVAFDWFRLVPGIDPSQMTDTQLENDLDWKPCTRGPGSDPDDGVPSSPIGRQYKFVWDSKVDVGTVHAQFILRARPFDAKREHGAYVYLRAPVTVDNWKVFNTGDIAGLSDLSGGRVGLTITNLTPNLPLSDPLRQAPSFQNLLVAGGAATQGGGGTTNLDLFNVNAEAAETSTAERAAFSSLQTPRAWHTATGSKSAWPLPLMSSSPRMLSNTPLAFRSSESRSVTVQRISMSSSEAVGVEVVFGTTPSMVMDGGLLLLRAKAPVTAHSPTRAFLPLPETARIRTWTPGCVGRNAGEPGLFSSSFTRP
jgi:hypothetical protein